MVEINALNNENANAPNPISIASHDTTESPQQHRLQVPQSTSPTSFLNRSASSPQLRLHENENDNIQQHQSNSHNHQHHHHHHHHHEHTASAIELGRERRQFWKKPQLLHSDWEEIREHKASWEELFYDLLFVAAAANLAYLLIKKISAVNFLTTFLFFLTYWWTWHVINGLSSRFLWNDRINRFLFFVHMVGVGAMVEHTQNGFKSKSAFAIGFLISRVGILIWYMILFHHVKRARFHSTLAIISISVSMILWGASLAVADYGGVAALWVVAIAMEMFGLALFPIPTKHRVRVNVGHVLERQGLFVILLLGESIIALIFPVSLSDLSNQVYGGVEIYFFLFFAFMTVFGLQLYFDIHPTDQNEQTLHAMHRSRVAGRFFLILHLFMCFSILVVGASLKLLVKSINGILPEGMDPITPLYMISVSTGVTLLIMQVMRYLHRPKKIALEKVKELEAARRERRRQRRSTSQDRGFQRRQYLREKFSSWRFGSTDSALGDGNVHVENNEKTVLSFRGLWKRGSSMDSAREGDIGSSSRDQARQLDGWSPELQPSSSPVLRPTRTIEFAKLPAQSYSSTRSNSQHHLSRRTDSGSRSWMSTYEAEPTYESFWDALKESWGEVMDSFKFWKKDKNGDSADTSNGVEMSAMNRRNKSRSRSRSRSPNRNNTDIFHFPSTIPATTSPTSMTTNNSTPILHQVIQMTAEPETMSLTSYSPPPPPPENSAEKAKQLALAEKAQKQRIQDYLDDEAFIDPITRTRVWIITRWVLEILISITMPILMILLPPLVGVRISPMPFMAILAVMTHLHQSINMYDLDREMRKLWERLERQKNAEAGANVSTNTVNGAVAAEASTTTRRPSITLSVHSNREGGSRRKSRSGSISSFGHHRRTSVSSFHSLKNKMEDLQNGNAKSVEVLPKGPEIQVMDASASDKENNS